MSARDYHLYHNKLPALGGRRCFVTLATNSIKLHIDEVKKDGTFLWLDPPWEFRKDGAVIESSASCPDHTEQNYERCFHDWAAPFQPIFESIICGLTADPNGGLQVCFPTVIRSFFLKTSLPKPSPGTIIGITRNRKRPNHAARADYRRCWFSICLL
jgi:hypothetical protein